MDRSKWEYKKWADVLNIINGRDYKEVAAVDGAYPICGSGGEIGRASEYLCPENTVIIGRKGNINKPIFIEEKFWNIDTAFGLVAKSSYLIPRFLFYFCLHYDFERHNKAVTIPSLTKGDLLKIDMLLPSLSDQQRIVAELDCLNEMIALKQGQLKEFDKLAQSIFYDMFGDPVENTKGWKQCLLKDVTSIITDGDHMPPPKSETGVPFVTISNVDKEAGLIDFSDTFFVPQEYYDNIPDNKKPHVGDILYTVTGSYGIPILIKDDKAFCFQRHIGLIRPISEINPVFMCLWAGCQPVKRYADRVATGVAQKTVSLKALRNFPIILPPLALQQQFAEKIQAIEAQKELVKQSIAETQQLLDSRMDYYFD